MNSRPDSKTFRGRGAGSNPANRFDQIHVDLEASESPDEEAFSPQTVYLRDSSRSILSENNSPDLGFQFSVNPYRGCEHGCAYCYARPSHEYLGYSAGLEFETKIVVKLQAAELLREKLMSRSWQPQTIVMSGITDCYQPVERKLRLTRSCLEVLKEFKNPVAMITKNELITRDLDLLAEMAIFRASHVTLSVTTLDDDLAAALEPRTSRPGARLRAMETLARAGVPVCVNVAPIIPGLTDHELPAILKAASEAGATSAAYTLIRLPSTVLEVFTDWLQRNRPLRREKILNAIREIRGGKMNDPQFGSRMTGQGPLAAQIRQMFSIYQQKYKLDRKNFELSTEHFKRPAGPQMELFSNWPT